MSMSKKDYEAIAQAINGVRAADTTPERVWAIGSVCNALASVMSANNPSFDRARFLAACGITEE